MKKVSLLILLAIVASALLTAAIPTKMVRLTIINKSGYDVYMKLEGSAVTEAYYYLTIPAGDRDEPIVKVFTIMSDVYDRTTWQCDGRRTSGSLIVDGNIRLTFTPCGEFLTLCARAGFWWFAPRCYAGVDAAGNPVYTGTWYWHRAYARNQGEPRMEKVVSFRYLYGPYAPTWADAYLYTGFINAGCYTWYYRIRSYNRPSGCTFRYQY